MEARRKSRIRWTRQRESRFSAYVEMLTAALGHADRQPHSARIASGCCFRARARVWRRWQLGSSRRGCRRRTSRCITWSPKPTGRMKQCLPQCVSISWLAASSVVPSAPGSSTTLGFPKQGTHSVGVARQYCGQLGKQDNCQVAVSLSIANDHASLPIAYRLYLPEPWANDPIRRDKAGVPDAVRFETKPQIALGQIRAALAAGVPPAAVLTDAGYGVDTDFRDGVTALGLALCRRHPVLDQPLVTGNRAAAAEALARTRASALADPSRSQA